MSVERILPATLRAHLRAQLEPWPGRPETWLLAFSGGPDSLSLAILLDPLCRAASIRLELVHVDHGLDPESGARASAAKQLACELGLPFFLLDVREAVGHLRHCGPEAAARFARYEALDAHRRTRAATRLLVAHHADDVAETLLLRLLRGTGLRGLAAMSARTGPLWRPALSLRRSDLRSILAHVPLRPVEDPSNLDPRQPRCRVRSWLAREAGRGEDPTDSLCRLAAQAARTQSVLRQKLETWFGDLLDAESGVELPRLLSIPEQLRVPVLSEAWIRLVPHEPGPGPARMGRLLQQLGRRGTGSWSFGKRRWVVRSGKLLLEKTPSTSEPFAYSVTVPGRRTLPEIGKEVRLAWADRTEPWMFRGDSLRAALGVTPEQAASVVIRTRQAGDRLQPLGGSASRKLGNLLTDRKIPRAERERLPILEIGGRIAWVPGVAIGETFRVRQGVPTLVAELVPAEKGRERSA